VSIATEFVVQNPRITELRSLKEAGALEVGAPVWQFEDGSLTRCSPLAVQAGLDIC